MKKRTILPLLSFLLAGIVIAALGAGGAWWLLRPHSASAASAPEKAEKPVVRDAKYVSLEKIIVMLRNREGEPLSHYMAVDLVFRADPKLEKTVRDQLPLLRSIAVRHLSSYTVEKASMATVDDLTTDINKAYSESYKRDDSVMPFSDVMIGKLVIE